MRIGLVFFVLFAVFQALSQEDTVRIRPKIKCKISQHELEVDPISVWMNKELSLGHRVKYTYMFDYHRKISAETNGTLINALDASARGGKWQGVFPNLNQSQIYFEKFRYYARTKPGRQQFISRIIYRAGYHYFQHSTGTKHRDYWSIDSSAQKGLRTIAGFKSHSALIGISYDIKIWDFSKYRVRTFNHRISVDYYFSPYYQLKLYDSESETDFNVQTLKSPLPVNRSGARMSYRFMFEFKERLGIHADFEALWVPFLKNYQPNDDYFVPRGGEKITPIFLNARVGMYWMF